MVRMLLETENKDPQLNSNNYNVSQSDFFVAFLLRTKWNLVQVNLGKCVGKTIGEHDTTMRSTYSNSSVMPMPGYLTQTHIGRNSFRPHTGSKGENGLGFIWSSLRRSTQDEWFNWYMNADTLSMLALNRTRHNRLRIDIVSLPFIPLDDTAAIN